MLMFKVNEGRAMYGSDTEPPNLRNTQIADLTPIGGDPALAMTLHVSA
jgi:hypothetical protein